MGALLKHIRRKGPDQPAHRFARRRGVLEHMIAPTLSGWVCTSSLALAQEAPAKPGSQARLLLADHPAGPRLSIHCATDWGLRAPDSGGVGANPDLVNTATGFAKARLPPPDQVRKPRTETGPWRVGSGCSEALTGRSPDAGQHPCGAFTVWRSHGPAFLWWTWPPQGAEAVFQSLTGSPP